MGGWPWWVLPCPLSPAWGHRTGDSPIIQLFSILILLPLSTVLQKGNREFSWSGFPLMLVLTHAKVGRVTWESPHRWQQDSYLTNVLVSLLQNKLSYFYLTLTTRCPCCYPYSTPQYGSSCDLMVLPSCSYGSLGGMGLSGRKKTACPTQRPIYSFPYFHLHLRFHLNPIYSLTFFQTFPHRSYLLLALGEGKRVFSLFCISTQLFIYTYQIST